jgi:hypothetical protein
MKTEKVMEQHTVTLVKGEAVIHTVTVTTKRRPYKADAELRHILDKLAGWRPADNWSHVISLLNKDKTYIMQNGARESVKFSDYGGRVA